MKNLIICIVCILMCSCRQSSTTKTANAEHLKNISFKDVTVRNFYNAGIFSDIAYTSLETQEQCLIGDFLSLKACNNDYYVFDQNNQSMFRFADDGRFMNRIGQRGKGPNEYATILDFAIDRDENTIDLLTAPKSDIYRYRPDGSWVTSVSTDGIPAQSMAKLKGHYLLNIGYSNYFSEERLYRVDGQGKTISKFHPIVTKLFNVTEPNFFQTDSVVYFHESFCNVIYDVTTDEVKPLHTFDFGNYNIPDIVHEMDPMEVFGMLDNKGMINIRHFCFNKNFTCLFLSQQQTGQLVQYHYIIDNNTGNQVALKIPVEDWAMETFGIAQFITENDELVFLAQPAGLIEIIKNHPFFKGDIDFPINADMNPFIAKFKLKSF